MARAARSAVEGRRTVLSIGRLGCGKDAAEYYLRRQAGCELDYYTGAGERAGRWCGSGAAALGLSGDLDGNGEQALRGLLAGCGPDGEQLVAPVLRTAGAGRLPARQLVEAVTELAAERGVEPGDLLGSEKLAAAYGTAERAVAADRRRARMPRASLRADAAGAIAEAAGLDPHRLFRSARGHDRYGPALARAGERVDVRRAGLDLCFSAPKSVSVLYGLADPHISGQVRAAHTEAISQALGYLERMCGHGFRGHHGGRHDDKRRTVATDGLIGAAFEHRSSRAGDPQLHTHVVVANLLRGEDGKWSALDTRALYRQAATAGYLYQTVLRSELTRSLGVGWGDVRRGAAEIDGIPTELRRLFSARRAAIEAELARTGHDGRAAAQAATLATRPDKAAVDARTLRGRWAQRAAGAGFDPDRLAEQVLARVAPPALPEDAELAGRLLGADGLTRRRATFDRRALLRGLCEAIPPGVTIDVATLRSRATTLIRDPQVVPLLADRPAERRRYSTADLLGTERRALAAAKARRADGLAVVDPAVRAAAADRASLSGEQEAMVAQLTSSGAGVEIAVGPAGSGKTAALAAARAAWTAAGYRVIGASVAAIAARSLEDGSGIPASSLTRLAAETERRDPDTGKQAGLPAHTVLVVDEAGMVGTRALAELIEATRAWHTKLVLVGDPAQLPEIDAGGLFATLAAQLPAARLSGNQRQLAGWERDTLSELRDGDVLAAVDAYAAHDRLRLAGDTDESTEQIVADYLAASAAAGPGQTLIIASRRSDARRLNETVRAELIAAGTLGEQELTVTVGSRSRGFRVGEQVVVAANDYRHGLLNGSRGQIDAVDPEGGTARLRLPDGRQVDCGPQWLASGRLEHAYALTCHRAQGMTIDTALLFGTAALCREAGYVALSRGRSANYLYATLDGLLPDRNPMIDRPRAEPHLGRAERDELTRAAVVERLDYSQAQRPAMAWQPPEQFDDDPWAEIAEQPAAHDAVRTL